MLHSAALILLSSLVLPFIHVANAATAEEWRGRSIYQIIVDRFALPEGADTTACDPGRQTFCGGTWNTIRERLDYIQNAGFTAIWISPVSQNYDGPRTPYGDPYHGYWISDVTKLNSRFGTAEDLKALSDELHRRGMYLMVDVVVNNVMATSTTPDYSSYLFKDESYYHPYCPMDYTNRTSEQLCWMGDTNVTLPDVRTEDPAVIETYGTWIQDLVREYNIDGLRIDAAKHVDSAFWPQFCAKAGVFCIGEVFDSDVAQASEFQGPLDSILHYPMYNALVNAFAIPGPQNMSAVVDAVRQSREHFKDTTLLGNFLENHDLPRWSNLSVDQQSLYNAMVYNFMSDGIPIVYYGQEQRFTGIADPYNREPLWTSGYEETRAYKLIQTLNKIRNFLVNTSDFTTQPMEILTANQGGLAIQKGKVVSIITNIGSPPANLSIPAYTPWPRLTILTEILSCTQVSVGSSGTIQRQYEKGGQAAIFLTNADLEGSGLCGFSDANAADASGLSSSSRPALTMDLSFTLAILLGGIFSLALSVV